MAADSIVHARLDPETRRILSRLRRRTGLRDSELIRRALRVLGSIELASGPIKVVGVGAFASEVDDLGSNKERLRGFGGS